MQSFFVPNRRNRCVSLGLAIFWLGFSWFVLTPEAHAESSSSVDHGPLPMIVLGLIMVATYVAIAFELLHKSLAAMTGACLATMAAVAFGLYGERGFEKVHDTIGHDLGVLGVLLGTSILVEIAGHSGLFHFISVKIVKKTEGESRRLFAWMAVLTVVFCTFLTIAPGTLIMVTLALAVTRELKLDPKPYIIMIALVANSGALMTFASGICTMMIGSKAGLAYLDFFRVTTPIAIITAFVAFLVVRRVYRTSLVDTAPADERAEKVAGFDEWALVHDRRIFWRSAIILLLTTVGFATAQTMGVGLDLVALTGGVAALLFSGFDTEKAIKKVKWPLIVFFIGLFVIIGAVQESGLLVKLAGGIEYLSGGNGTATMLIMAVFVLVLSGIVDNIPVAATLIPITVAMGQNGADVTPLWWTLVICSNLGGNSTPVGSVSSVIALHALEQDRGIKIGWGEFLRIGGLTLACQGVVAIIYLYAFLSFDLFPRD
ncbi:MAG: Na+/H+ antiporter NhaD/arsenite permease-like protein [Planctomycetota bacterium]|jgi:Na+/H+ antiporter NhaD/arsenite permease-like protein